MDAEAFPSEHKESISWLAYGICAAPTLIFLGVYMFVGQPYRNVVFALSSLCLLLAGGNIGYSTRTHRWTNRILGWLLFALALGAVFLELSIAER